MASPANKNNIVAFPGIQRSAGGSGTGGTPTNLPTPATGFIGRAAQVGEVIRLIAEEDVRILTLTGPGGVGKTRLAVKACEGLLPDFADGVFFVSLASIMEPGLVVPAIAGTLGLKVSGNTKLGDALSDFLQDKDLLLLLDNFEQVASAGPDVTRLLANAPGVRLMITSRTALRLYGEYDWQVPPMDLPDEGEVVKASAGAKAEANEDILKEIGNCEAIQLFIARGKEVRPGFALTAANSHDVVEICRRLDGLPLALELAAARLRIFSPQGLLKRLDKVLPMLVEGAKDLPDRQRTLRNAIEWSYNLLDENGRKLFALMSVFLGGCTIEAAQQVWDEVYAGGSHEDASGEIVERLESLVAQNLVRQREQEDGEPRFWMLATIREFALEKLIERGLGEKAQAAHARFFVEMAEASRDGYVRGEYGDGLARLDENHDNLRAALRWSLDQKEQDIALRLVFALDWFWHMRGYWVEGSRWLKEALVVGDEPTLLRAKALYSAGMLAQSQNDYAQTGVYSEEALSLFQAHNDKTGVARVLSNLGAVAAEMGDYDLSLARFEQSLAIWRELEHSNNEAMQIGNICFLAIHKGDFRLAVQYGEESFRIQRARKDDLGIVATGINLALAFLHLGNYARGVELLEGSLEGAKKISSKRDEGLAYIYLGLAALMQEDRGAAAPHYRQSLSIAEEVGNLFGVARSLIGLATIAAGEGDWREAVILSGTINALIEKIHAKPVPGERALLEKTVKQSRAQLGEDAYQEALRQAQAMSRTDIIAVALGRQSLPVVEYAEPVVAKQPEPAAAQSGEITARELEVLRLITAGLTNKEIGERLVLSHRTVQAHLYRIFSKLNVTTRTAATRYALEHGLA